MKPSTYDRMYRPVLGAVLDAMHRRPAPVNGRELLAALRDGCGGQPGSRGRTLRIQYACQFLRFVVGELGAPERWLPPEDLVPFIGRPLPGAGGGDGVTPIKDEQVLRLLPGIPDSRWRLAVGLLVCFGLRPVELRYLHPQGDKLEVTYQKRTARGTTSPGLVPGLDPLGLEGESQRLLQLLVSGEVVLPPLGARDGDAAQRVRQYLDRRSVWKQLKEETAATGGRLAAYSFRHGYALRAHQLYALSPRITAAFMRHSLVTHHQGYGTWTDRDTLEAALDRGRKHRDGIAAGFRAA